jgi:N,N'-diacetylchitobiose transport system substrate-binding protein
MAPLGNGATSDSTPPTSTNRLGRRQLIKQSAGLGLGASLFGSLLTTQPVGAQEATPEVLAQPTVVPAADAVMLEYWELPRGRAAFMAQLQDNVTEFNTANPGIHVTLRELAFADYTQKILAASQAGDPPDMSGGGAGFPFVMAAQGQALDISDLYEEWKADGTLEDMSPWAYEKWNFQGTHPGITWQFDTRGIYYRKDLFEQAGIEPPTTWDELMAAAAALHKPDEGVMGIAVPGMQGSFDTVQFYMQLLFQAGGGLADEAGNPTFDTPEALAATEFLKELVQKYAAPGTPSWAFTEVGRSFLQGNAAMAFEGGWFIRDLREGAPDMFDKVGLLEPLEGPGGPDRRLVLSFANPWMLYAQSPHQEEAKTFLKWMMKPENMQKLYESEPGAAWPVYRSLLDSPVYQENELIKTMARHTVESGVDYWYPNTAAAIGIASLGTSIADIIVNPVITDARSPQDALADAQSSLAELFQQQGA